MNKFTLLLAFILMGCASQKNEHETLGAIYIEKARTALTHKRFDQARTLIKQLRDSVPLALNARETGIIIMDSIELCEAQENLRMTDSLLRSPKTENMHKDSVQNQFNKSCQKVKFYLRKIQHDFSNKKTYKD